MKLPLKEITKEALDVMLSVPDDSFGPTDALRVVFDKRKLPDSQFQEALKYLNKKIG